jgi:hypothetical protein
MRLHCLPLSGLSCWLSQCWAHRRIHLRRLTFRLRRYRAHRRAHRFYLRLRRRRAHRLTLLLSCRAHRRTRQFNLRPRRCRAHRRTRQFYLCRALAFWLRRCQAHRRIRRFYLRLLHCRAHRRTRRTPDQVNSRKQMFRVLPNVVALVHQRVLVRCLKPSALQSLRKRTMQKSQSISGTSER